MVPNCATQTTRTTGLQRVMFLLDSSSGQSSRAGAGHTHCSPYGPQRYSSPSTSATSPGIFRRPCARACNIKRVSTYASPYYHLATPSSHPCHNRAQTSALPLRASPSHRQPPCCAGHGHHMGHAQHGDCASGRVRARACPRSEGGEMPRRTAGMEGNLTGRGHAGMQTSFPPADPHPPARTPATTSALHHPRPHPCPPHGGHDTAFGTSDSGYSRTGIGDSRTGIRHDITGTIGGGGCTHTAHRPAVQNQCVADAAAGSGVAGWRPHASTVWRQQQCVLGGGRSVHSPGNSSTAGMHPAPYITYGAIATTTSTTAVVAIKAILALPLLFLATLYEGAEATVMGLVTVQWWASVTMLQWPRWALPLPVANVLLWPVTAALVMVPVAAMVGVHAARGRLAAVMGTFSAQPGAAQLLYAACAYDSSKALLARSTQVVAACTHCAMIAHKLVPLCLAVAGTFCGQALAGAGMAALAHLSPQCGPGSGSHGREGFHPTAGPAGSTTIRVYTPSWVTPATPAATASTATPAATGLIATEAVAAASASTAKPKHTSDIITSQPHSIVHATPASAPAQPVGSNGSQSVQIWEPWVDSCSSSSSSSAASEQSSPRAINANLRVHVSLRALHRLVWAVMRLATGLMVVIACQELVSSCSDLASAVHGHLAVPQVFREAGAAVAAVQAVEGAAGWVCAVGCMPAVLAVLEVVGVMQAQPVLLRKCSRE